MPSQLPLAARARQSLPKELKQFLEPLLGKTCSTQNPTYLVGGCVRDLLLNRPSLDVDVVLEGSVAPVARAAAREYKAKLISHPQFLTFTLQMRGGRHLDIATARTETYSEAAALPVVEPASLQEDLYRRDFSINAIALSLNPSDFGHVWDPFGGVEDLLAKKIRVLHSQSFKDDPTRIFRAARFAGRFGYELEWRTREWLTESIAQQLPARLSGARLREELIPLLMEKDPRPAFRLLSQWGALPFLVPNLKWEKSHDTFFGQVIRHPEKESSLLLRLLVLLHAIPFPKAVGSLGHLMFPQGMIEQIELALTIVSKMRDGSLTFADMRRNSKKTLPSVVKSFIEKAVRMKALAPKKEVLADWQRFQDSTPSLTGRDVRDLGYKPGPVYTRIFEALRQARWEGKLRTREEEIRFLENTFPLNHGH
jgi:tRNA nucleotidyltransferase (CCA-adding enzyme)